ncbi:MULTISPECIES: BMP family ABC transporter substrate-binding protein [unclassified Faecalibacterium]|uniref:BMP family lipoprotein n=1 Tax=unclassified Faecalibacterium TaxID=2646395 RepID=UPI001FA90572|nr:MULTISPECIES: BMP family ABC transporter substrate-binding protein [unclassified Faecalibacterium]
MNMISRRKFMAVAGAAAAVSVLTACGSSSSTASSTAASSSTASSAASGEAAEGTAVSYVALCCDTGTIDDESFNQACWTAVQNYMGDNCQYYIPEADASDEDRETMIRQAVNDGADTVVCVGYLYGASLAWAAEQYPDTRFIAIDVTQADIGTDTIPANCYCITFKEEQAGYLAGYAIAKDGFTKLGFLGGMAVPAVIRYGYGYIQGIDAAAQETGNAVEVNYYYGGQFYGDANITSRMEGWYTSGTEVVFACGGGIYTSALEAAIKSNGYVIGVDVDQNYIGANGVADGTYSYNPFITSAMKQLTVAVESALGDIDDGEWTTIAATNGNFGLEEGDYVGLPTAEDSWNFRTFTVEEYEAVKAKIASGEIVVDNSSEDSVKPTTSDLVKVTYVQ